MKHLFIIIAICCLAAPSAIAQSGLHINALFDGRYRHAPNATETIIKGNELNSFALSVYHSITLRDASQTAISMIEELVSKDGIKALNKITEFQGGRLRFGYYALPPVKRMNRYILYKHSQRSGDVTLIYMEGLADSADIKGLIKK